MCTCFIKGSWFQFPCSFFLVSSFQTLQVPPSSTFSVPGFFYQFQGFRYQVPQSFMLLPLVHLFQKPGSFKFHVPGFKFLILVSWFQIPGSYKCHMSQVYISGSFTRFLLQFWGSNDPVPSSDQFLDSRFKVQLFSTINSSFKQ